MGTISNGILLFVGLFVVLPALMYMLAKFTGLGWFKAKHESELEKFGAELDNELNKLNSKKENKNG